MAATIKCPVHPRYQGKWAPTSLDFPCVCSEIWNIVKRCDDAADVHDYQKEVEKKKKPSTPKPKRLIRNVTGCAICNEDHTLNQCPHNR